MVFGNFLDDPAFFEEQADTIAAGNADIGRGGLAGAIDDTSHDGDFKRGFIVAGFLFDGFGQGDGIDLAPSTGGAGDDIDAFFFKIQ